MSGLLAITGATGKKSGGAFAEKLSKNPDTLRRMFPDGVRVVARVTSDISGLDRNLPGAERCTGELTDINFLRKSFEGVDTVFHIAGIHWSREVVSAAAYCRVRRLVVVHTTGIYSRYKEAGEEYRQIDAFVSRTCGEKGIILTTLRPTMIYGNLSDRNVGVFIKMVDRLPLMPVVNGAHYELQPVHYKDLADAYFAVLAHEAETAGRDFVLSGGEPVELREMLRVIGEGLGKKTRFISCPFSLAYAGACVIYGLTFRKIDYREKVQRLCEPRAYPHGEATEAFGFAPRTFPEGLREEIQEYIKLKNR